MERSHFPPWSKKADAGQRQDVRRPATSVRSKLARALDLDKGRASSARSARILKLIPVVSRAVGSAPEGGRSAAHRIAGYSTGTITRFDHFPRDASMHLGKVGRGFGVERVTKVLASSLMLLLLLGVPAGAQNPTRVKNIKLCTGVGTGTGRASPDARI